ncbi:fibronectin type III domain-containing protein [Candidatus Woesearchaeota archaeon]|nr:fibronectin type III domain-containing protein [Candidatus Woesearchaeota archaeon]
MKKLPGLLSCIFLLFVGIVYSLGSIQTQIMHPSQIDLCGNYQQYVTITASNIYNKENTTITNVVAELVIPGSAGLNFVSSKFFSIGNINALSYSSLNPSWTIQCNSPVQGVYSAYVNYSSSNNYRGSSIDEVNTVLVVHEATPLDADISIIEGTPTTPTEENIPVIADNTPTIVVYTNRDAICKGSLDKDELYEDLDFVFYGTSTYHNYTFVNPIQDGEHTVFVRCKDSLNNIMPVSSKINFIIDTAPPEITLLAPQSVVLDTFTKFEIQTNEESDCVYSDDDDDDFDDMIDFDTVTGNTFTTTLYDVRNGEEKYYVKCKDLINNLASASFIIKIEEAPSAEIIISQKPPLKEGTYQLRLMPSKKLRSIPFLSYSFTDEPSFNREISLIKEDSYYKGYLILDSYETNRVGFFRFEGYDISGNRGTEITEGSLFLVDTIKPGPVNSIEISAVADDFIALRWYYEGEEEDHFIVYKSTSSGVDYIHNYDTAASEEFEDEDVQPGVTYYYRVAAVDSAGNIGPLSREISGTATGQAQETQSTVQVDKPKTDTLYQYNKTLKSIESLYIDIEWAKNNLNELRTKESAVDELNLLKDISDASEELDKLKNQLNNVFRLSPTDTELKQVITKAEQSLATIKKTTPQKIEVSKKSTQVQPNDEMSIDTAIQELLKNTNYTEKQIRKYAEVNNEIQSDVKVESEIKTLTIEYLNGDSSVQTFIIKKVSYESPDSLNSVKLVEIIPKTVASDISTIDFRTPDYIIVNEDPVVMWDLDQLSYEKRELQYIIFSEDKSESAKSARTIVLLNPEDAIEDDGNIITGFTTLISGITAFSVIQSVGIFIGILLVIGLLLYYIIVVKEVPMPAITNRINIFKKNEEVQKIDDNLITSPHHYFYLQNGDVIRSLSELLAVVSQLEDVIYYYHANDQKNDFVNWIRAVFNKNDLADALQNAKSREEFVNLLQKYLL